MREYSFAVAPQSLELAREAHPDGGMTTEIPIGAIETPRGWEVQTQLDLIEPAMTHAVPLSMNSEAPHPRANLVIRRTATDSHLQEVVSDLMSEIAEACPGYGAEAGAAFEFDDGAEGIAITVHFSANAQYRVVQRHITRIDQGILTHLTLTVDEPSRIKLDGKLDAIARSYRPPAER